ncbi:hypothetical protein KFE25_004241 [Diacronema lutheri]|uniref:Uncharacterized protein n=1 Tax=Diacronema lutheri TaxID=2081491 RepID=A0A8J5X999_DIALT|nr:hypothetical protein KFE25_004241 [Diacronema lutheri]
MGAAPGRELTEYEKYMQKRVESGENLDETYSDLGVEMDFDGGDSGSGAVGDGQVTLDNQHDSPFLVGGGGQRDAVEGAAAIANLEMAEKTEEVVEAAMSARDAKQKNYWGRQIGTGYADELLKEGKFEDRPVLRQQLENWQNQQSLKVATDASTEAQTTFFGVQQADQATDWKKTRGRPIDQLRTTISVQNVGSSQRLDGEEWGELAVRADEPIEATHEVLATPSAIGVLEIEVLNELSAFSPFRCGFTADSPSTMTLSPSEGVMEKRETGHPVTVLVRFTPEAYGNPLIGTIVFETEDFRKVYKVVGKTAH